MQYPNIGDRVQITMKGEVEDLYGRVEDIHEPNEQGKLSLFAIRIKDIKKTFWFRRSDFRLVGRDT